MTNRYYRGPPSDHFDGTLFFNPGHPDTDRGLGEVLRWRLGGKRPHWPTAVPGRQTVPDARVAELRVTMIGHASVLIQTAGLNLLVDPVWSDRVSPVPWAGPRRVNPPGVAFDRLPPIDAVLLTHNHYDHLDIATLKRVWAGHGARVIAPLGNDAVIARSAPDIAVETRDWWQEVALADDATVTLCPANHWSARGVGDRRMALWGGFVVRTGAGQVYIAGDTGYGDGHVFRDVRARLGAPDLAILPIGAYEPRWFMAAQHTDPDQAVRIMLNCGARQALGVHWGTFALTNEPRTEPREALAVALAERAMPASSFLALEPGDVWSAPA